MSSQSLRMPKIFDNDGDRRSRVRKTLFDALGVAAEDGLLGGQGFVEHTYLWRGTRRRSMYISRPSKNSPSIVCAGAKVPPRSFSECRSTSAAGCPPTIAHILIALATKMGPA